MNQQLVVTNSKYDGKTYKKSGEYRVNIVNVTLNHRHKKAKKHKDEKKCRANK